MTEATTWVYIDSRDGPNVLYTVGFYDPNGNWHTDSDHDTRRPAGERVNFLNGGPTENAINIELQKINITLKKMYSKLK